jgi:hypothetical protein
VKFGRRRGRQEQGGRWDANFPAGCPSPSTMEPRAEALPALPVPINKTFLSCERGSAGG